MPEACAREPATALGAEAALELPLRPSAAEDEPAWPTALVRVAVEPGNPSAAPAVSAGAAAPAGVSVTTGLHVLLTTPYPRRACLRTPAEREIGTEQEQKRSQ